MGEAATYTQNPILVALRSWLEAAITQPGDDFAVMVSISVAPGERPSAFCVLEQLPGVRTSLTALSFETMLTARYQVTTCGKNRSMVGVVSDRVRVAFSAPDDDGPAEPIALPGVLVLRREGQEDGVFDVVSGLPQWTETFELDLVPST